ncbi:flavodoxin FldA [Candidatus Schneideria nysicola]|uniref:flavodoxin FldA n=1 Tax=Candidatus Schneideria nysicola TaxID=1081631 RepID=UPI001CAA7188|nr:flavodoxin FldA [Candidatus Schneideria nysicola]UAJ64805.1 flavodoxin FldA [Candidatus Schneideria nysicola]
MIKAGIFFGSDTGNTENVAYLIEQNSRNDFSIFDIAKSNKADLEKYNNLILGIPTWYYGEVQCDWDDFIPSLKKIDFYNKKVAIFGCGDQEDYAEYFCDAMGIIHNIVVSQGATVIGYWSNQGYHFELSKGLLNEKYFVGLAIDQDRQPELTIPRIKNWVNQIHDEFIVNTKKV